MNKEEFQRCNELFKQQLELGIIEMAPKHTPYNKHYLPHRHLIQGDKLRQVYDASAHSKGGCSLNSQLFVGPSMLKSLPALIIRFHTGNIAITADIEKAFHQLVLDEQDRDVTRFLWIKNHNKPVTRDNLLYYRFARVPFGVSSSPFLLNMCIQQLLADKGNEKILNDAARCFYADSLVSSFNNFQDVSEFHKILREKMKEASLNLRGWISNDVKSQNQFSKNLRGEHKVTSILGYLWDPIKDEIYLNKKDTLAAKLFIQGCWKLDPEFGWRRRLPKEQEDKWAPIEREISKIWNIRIPRQLWKSSCKNEEAQYHLHIFSDASKVAFACAAYIIQIQGTKCSSSLCFSKLKLAPAKMVREEERLQKEKRRGESSNFKKLENLKKKERKFTPRLELLGVLMAVRVRQFLIKNLHITFDKITLWTDATTILHWLNSPTIQEPFVQNRLTEIRSIANIDIRYTPRQFNPADTPTQGKSADVLINTPLWWNGPKWLLESDQENWPVPPDNCYNFHMNENSNIFTLITTQYNGPLTSEYETKFQTWSEYVDDYVKKHMEDVDFANLDEYTQIEEAQTRLIKDIQTKYCKKIIEGIQNEDEKSDKRELRLVIDEKGLLRSVGRLAKSNLSCDEVHPVYMPIQCNIVSAYLRQIHEKLNHAGVEHTLAESRKLMWIPKARRRIQYILKHCKQCLKWTGKHYRLPPMPPLPAVRLTDAIAFRNTGIDYFGPLYVKDETKLDGSKKMWVCLFTCLAVRAIHLEEVESLSADGFLLALRRFCSDRGTPACILSDNATNFRFVQPLVGEEVKLHDLLNDYTRQNGIRWTFTPVMCPWYGGVYERLVKSVKLSLAKGYDGALLNVVQFRTVLREVANIVNSRPLVYVGNSCELPLTPNDFLRLNNSQANMPLRVVQQRSINSKELLTSYRLVQRRMNEVWELFRSRYLLSLRESQSPRHPNWKKSSSFQPQVGHVVLLQKNALHRQNWPCGKIIKLDERGAFALVQYSQEGKMREEWKSVVHLYPIEVAE